VLVATTPVLNLDKARGETIQATVAVTEDDGSVSDLTGYVGEMQVRASSEDVDVLATGTVVIDTVTGLVEGTVDGADTESAEWSAAVYDMRIIGATTEYVVKGTIRLRQAVTR
jgi:hypothetical protein